jgi:hypothetical protein
MEKSKQSLQLVADGGQPPARDYSLGRLPSCAVEGCTRWVAAGEEYCAKCREEIDALDAMVAGPAPAGRLEKFAWASLCVAVVYTLLWFTRGFWLEWLDMIFGSAQ